MHLPSRSALLVGLLAIVFTDGGRKAAGMAGVLVGGVHVPHRNEENRVSMIAWQY